MKEIDIARDPDNKTISADEDKGLWLMQVPCRRKPLYGLTAHFLACADIKYSRLNDMSEDKEQELWDFARKGRMILPDYCNSKRILVSVNDGENAKQTVRQTHVHIIDIDYRWFHTSFARAVKKCFALPDQPAPSERILVAQYNSASCYIEQQGKSISRNHMVIKSDMARQSEEAENDMWALQRTMRRSLTSEFGEAMGFSIFADFRAGQNTEINIVPRLPMWQQDRSITDVIRKHKYKIPYEAVAPLQDIYRKVKKIGKSCLSAGLARYN